MELIRGYTEGRLVRGYTEDGFNISRDYFCDILIQKLTLFVNAMFLKFTYFAEPVNILRILSFL